MRAERLQSQSYASAAHCAGESIQNITLDYNIRTDSGRQAVVGRQIIFNHDEDFIVICGGWNETTARRRPTGNLWHEGALES